MLTREEIQNVLHADRVIDVPVPNTHGPLGLEHLSAEVSRLTGAMDHGHEVQRPICFPVATWEKLSGIARSLNRKGSQHVTASDVAKTLVLRAIESIER